MKKEAPIFPVTPANFTAYQASEIGRELNEDETEAVEAWIPVLNDSYEEGRQGGREGLISGCEKMDEYIEAQSVGNPVVTRFLRSMRWWIIYAWDQGNKGREGIA